MSVYRITRFAAADMDKVKEFSHGLQNELDALGAEFIDIVSYGNGKGVVLAKYSNQEAMDAAADGAKSIFGKLIEAGLVDGDAIHPHAGEVINSF